jgi:hypothetical protein
MAHPLYIHTYIHTYKEVYFTIVNPSSTRRRQTQKRNCKFNAELGFLSCTEERHGKPSAEYVKEGLNEVRNSPWSAPVLLVRKKRLNGKSKYRFCIDFRALNAMKKFDSFPLPKFEETTSVLAGSKYFSVIDCYSGFSEVNI